MTFAMTVWTIIMVSWLGSIYVIDKCIKAYKGAK